MAGNGKRIITTGMNAQQPTFPPVTNPKVISSGDLAAPAAASVPTTSPIVQTAVAAPLSGGVTGPIPLSDIEKGGAGIGDRLTWNGTTWAPVPDAPFADQATWWVDPVGGSDDSDGETQSSAVKTLGELFRRVGSPWHVTSDVNVHFVSYPPVTDPLRLLVKFHQNPVAGPTLTFHPPSFVQSGSGTLSAVTVHSANIPWEVTDGVVVTTGDVKKRIRISSGARVGACAWVARSTGAGRRRTSTFANWAATNLGPTIVTPQVGDPYIIESAAPGSFLYIDFIEVLPGSTAPFPNTCSLNIDGFDFRPIVDNATTMIINAGCALDIANTAFWHGEWQVRTKIIEGDNASGFTVIENCATFDGENNFIFLDGVFIDNYVWGGLFGGALWARQGGQFTVDFDALCQGDLGGVPGLFCGAGGAICVMTAGVMDMNANFGAVIVSDGVIGCRNDFSYSGNFGLWGTSSNSGAYGVNIRSGSNFRYMPGFPITITGVGGDFKMASATQARAWDDVAGAYTAKFNCTWANLFGGSLKDNAHDLPSDTHVYINVSGNAQP